MAGIGFELRKLLKSDSLVGLLQAYAYAGVISSGPWVLSIIGILVIGLLSVDGGGARRSWCTQFQVSVTYLIAVSPDLHRRRCSWPSPASSPTACSKSATTWCCPICNGVLLVVIGAGGAAGLLLLFLPFAGLSITVPAADAGGIRSPVRHLDRHHLPVGPEAVQVHRGAVCRRLRGHGGGGAAAAFLRPGGADGRLRARPFRALSRHVAAHLLRTTGRPTPFPSSSRAAT